MRVTGGELRGHTLKSPTGRQTRPMSDRLKLALFSMLAAQDQPRGRVLDLYAGTGALGIEALSRGAERSDFVEQNAGMCGVIRDNLAHTKLTGRGAVHRQSVSSYIAHPPVEPYDLIIMDPPYPDPDISATVQAVGESGLLAPDGLLVLGHSSRREFEERLGPLVLDRKRCHGDSCISFYVPGRFNSEDTETTEG
ncbi:MAG: 16S rRNA (guanine(966)-N(2))-methyltransferase RsmD [Chloroflexota bacterium]|nr:16S rRNA (guanine(966)-N(2))-methyltransferase RsmD [Chloroflexota bacterium]